MHMWEFQVVPSLHIFSPSNKYVSLDMCSRPYRALICEMELLLWAVRGSIHKRALTTEKREGEGWGFTRIDDQHLYILKATETLSMSLNLLFSPLRYWKSCCFAGQHFTQYNKWNLSGGVSVYANDIYYSVLIFISVIFLINIPIYDYFFIKVITFIDILQFFSLPHICSHMFYLYFIFTWPVNRATYDSVIFIFTTQNNNKVS